MRNVRRHIPAQRFRVGFLGLVLGLVGAAPAPAQRLFLPVEAEDGVLLAEGAPKPFTAAARLHPALGFGAPGRFRLGPSLAAAFANPGVSLQAGARAQVQVKSFGLEDLPVAGIDLAVEALWGTKDRNPIGGALLLSVNRVVQFTLRGGYDLGQEAAYLGTGVGTDLSFLFGIRPRPAAPPPVPFPPFEGCYAAVFDEARVQAQASFFDNAPLLNRTRRFLENGSQADRFLASGSLEQAGAVVAETAGLPELARQIDATRDAVLGIPPCAGETLDIQRALRAFYAAWNEAVALSDQ